MKAIYCIQTMCSGLTVMLTGFPESSLGTLISIRAMRRLRSLSLVLATYRGSHRLLSAGPAPYPVLSLLTSVATPFGKRTEVRYSFILFFAVIWLDHCPSISGINRYYEPRKE